MLSYLIRRVLLALFTCWAISVLAFVIIQLPPGDFVDAYIANLSASGSGISADQAQQLRAEYALDEPIYVQYMRWMRLMMRGDLGMAMEWQRPVTEVIGDRLWLTMVVSIAAVILTWLVALPIGIYSAVRPYSPLDYLFTLLGFLGLAIRASCSGCSSSTFGFVYFNANIGGLFSPQYVDAPWSRQGGRPAQAPPGAGGDPRHRQHGAGDPDHARQPARRAAQAVRRDRPRQGLSEWRAIWKYPVRVALNPFASTIGYTLPYVVSGSIIVSLVLGLPTVGPLLLRSLIAQDMFLAGAIVLLLGIMTVIGTLLSDLLLMWIDPRIRVED
jgi:peptide/nickel transport system permease protein